MDNPLRIWKRDAGCGDKRAAGVHKEELVDIFSLVGEETAYQMCGNGSGKSDVAVSGCGA